MIGRLIALLLLWYALTGGDVFGFGLAAAAAAAVAGMWIGSGYQAKPSPHSVPGVLRFLLHFLNRSLAGGADVAWRAFHPRMPLATRDYWRTLDLPGDAAAVFFIGALNLLPGTLACQYREGQVRIHSISEGTEPGLNQLERRVRAIFPAAAGQGIR